MELPPPRTAILAIGALVFLLGHVPDTSSADAPAPTIATATDLRVTRELNGQGTKLPMIATTPTGRAYVVWRFAAAETPPAGTIPFLPADCTFAPSPRHIEFTTVPGLSAFDGTAWATPQRLAAGIRECEAVAAWCAGEQLHLLVTTTFTDGVAHHVRYDPATKAWARLHTLAVPPSSATQFVARGESVYLASMRDGVKFWRYDGKAWSKPVAVESKDRDRPAVAVGADGVMHLCWHSVDGGDAVGYATIAADGKLTQRKTTLPIHGDDFDVAIGPGGEFLIAYQAELPKGHADADAVFVRSWADDKWSEPTLVGKGTGLMLGSIHMAAANKRVLLSWQHRARYTSGQMTVSGPVRSHTIFDGKVWSAPVPACKIPADAAGRRSIFARGGGFADAFFPALYADDRGRVHMAWEVESSSYHAVIADLGAAAR